MRRLLILFLILCCPLHAIAADVYFSKVGGTTYYNTTGWPVTDSDTASSLQGVMSTAGDNGNVYIDGGTSGITYSGADLDTDSALLVVYDINLYGSTDTDHDGAVTLDFSLSSQSRHIDVSDTGVHFENMTLYHSGTTGCIIRFTRPGTMVNVTLNGANTLLDLTSATAGENRFTRCTFTKADNIYYPVRAGAAFTQDAYFDFCAFIGIGNVRIYAGNSVSFNNCNFIGGKNQQAVEVRSGCTAAVTVNNSIVRGYPGNVVSNNVVFLNSGAGDGATLTLNNVDIPSPFIESQDDDFFGANVTVNNQVTGDPSFTQYRYPVKVALIIDDLINKATWDAIVTECDSRNINATFSMNLQDITAQNWTDVASDVANGHEVACHGVGLHADLTVTDGIDITYTLQGGETTAGIQVTDTIIRLWVDSAAYRSTALTGQTLSDLVTTINTWPNTVASLHTTGKHTYASAEDLAEISETDCTSGLHVQLDQTDYFATEITGAKSTIESQIGAINGSYTCKTLVYPQYEHDATVEAAVQAAGFIAAAGGASDDYLLSSLPMFKIYRFNVSDMTSYTDSQITTAMQSYAHWMQDSGGILLIHGHSLGTFSQAQWGVLIDALQSVSGVEIMTFGEIADWIVANGTTSDSGVTYTINQTDTLDMTLLSGSACTNTGLEAATVGLSGSQTDYTGNTYTFGSKYNLNIGADQTRHNWPPRILGGSLVGE